MAARRRWPSPEPAESRGTSVRVGGGAPASLDKRAVAPAGEGWANSIAGRLSMKRDCFWPAGSSACLSDPNLGGGRRRLRALALSGGLRRPRGAVVTGIGRLRLPRRSGRAALLMAPIATGAAACASAAERAGERRSAQNSGVARLSGPPTRNSVAQRVRRRRGGRPLRRSRVCGIA